MGSFLDSPDGLMQLGATAAGGAVGGPVGAGLANFGTSAIMGKDPMQALQGAAIAGAGAGIGGAGATAGAGGASSVAAAPAASNFGQDFLSGLGFGGTTGQNIANGGKLLLSALNTPSAAPSDPFSLLLPAPKPVSLMDTLNFRSQY